jgi:hypothetical protein
MGNATADKTARELAAAEQTEEVAEHLFRARGKEFRVVRVHRRQWTEDGMRMTSEGVSYDFSPTGDFRTTDPGAIAYLKSLDSFNRDFWLVGEEPGAAPSSEVIDKQIMSALARLDDEALVALEHEESEQHKREDVLRRIRQAREQVQGVLSEAAAEGAAEGEEDDAA